MFIKTVQLIIPAVHCNAKQRCWRTKFFIGLFLLKLKTNANLSVVFSGGFHLFQRSFPEWCEGSNPSSDDQSSAMDTSAQNPPPPLTLPGGVGGPPDPPIVGLKSLRITTVPGDPRPEIDKTVCDSSIGRETPFDDLCFPVEILPHLFLGNAKNSGDMDALNKHKIQVRAT